MPEKDVGSDLIGLLERATADDLAAIDSACEALRKKLNVLEAVRRIVGLSLNGKPERKNARRDGAGREAGTSETPVESGANPKNVVQLQRRRAIARLLGSSGPMKAMQIANRCDIPAGSITSVLSCDWFKAADDGFRLTEVGRREAGL